MGKQTPESVSKKLENILNRHGFSYHFKVMDRAEELREKKLISWLLEGTEIPVGSGVDVIHVDFVLFQQPAYDQSPSGAYLVAECKRVDPALGIWAFARSPYSWRNPHRTNNYIQFDRMEQTDVAKGYVLSTLPQYTDQPIYDLSFEVKTDEKGDATAVGGRSTLSSAVTQVLRGTKGYIEYLSSVNDRLHRQPLRVLSKFAFIPAIFTTAQIFVTDSDIRASDLERGHLELGSVNAVEKPWIWLNHNRTLNLSPNLSFDYTRNKDMDQYFLDFTRSIAIVGPDGIDGFLRMNHAGAVASDARF